MKIAIVLGTRPEIIKMASIIDEIRLREHELILIHTGQHYDHEMSDQFFEELELPSSNYNIGVGSGFHGTQTGKMMEGIEKVLIDEKPAILLVQGDTNAVLAGALVASKLHIPVGHVEAGLRSFDETMPEEINRKAADVCSKLYFVPTEKSAINLSLEGIARKKIFITGNTIVDACFRNLKIAKKRNLREFKELLNLNNILTLTMHRAENVDNKERLKNVIDAIAKLKEFNVVFPIHPRTKKTLMNFDLYDALDDLDHVYLIKPLGYLEFLLLLSKSSLILTDSGGLQEEAITLNIPALTLRYNTERPETVTAGGNILVGSDKEEIVETANLILNDKKFSNKMKSAKNPYGDGSSGEQILNIIENTYHNNMLAIKSPDTIMQSFTTEIKMIDEDITVSEFENKNNSLIKVAYDNDYMKFPFDDLNIKGMYILFDKLS
ncbi:UDP-2,3-diacetamido-2,3-dideoxy-D-glucuronate 2-epimerase [Methanobrevibacter cuticularis]|uniref:UDP-2,3-diacetamido-2,3-dideoxy-D-glucuronate 2-epimerase n=1 Tax=Methanobrevibacter cuticularis TaxID=47311 RepID=A0A166CXR2_9EURY|nr:UDP-N-acetylglucosamine 2-epimerase (non-hydrolyzing) [Methanobrevibacter cuticularis]KZX14975.1 UDP-2,3-diacetamido-2,3-dideoxy-D-glucuronate 2-epimerase [Methanobrevibacter cuticularis]